MGDGQLHMKKNYFLEARKCLLDFVEWIFFLNRTLPFKLLPYIGVAMIFLKGAVGF